MMQHKWTKKQNLLNEKGNHKRIHTGWFHLHKSVASKTKFIFSTYDIVSKIMKLSKGMTTIKFRNVCGGGEGKERGWGGALFKLYICNIDFFIWDKYHPFTLGPRKEGPSSWCALGSFLTEPHPIGKDMTVAKRNAHWELLLCLSNFWGFPRAPASWAFRLPRRPT